MPPDYDIPGLHQHPDLWLKLEARLKRISTSGKCCTGEREKALAEFHNEVTARELARKRTGR